MHRLLVETVQLHSDAPALPKEALAHLRVLRPKDGEPFEFFDGKGRARTFRFRRGAASAVCWTPEDHVVRLAPRLRPLTLFACVTKGSRWDWTIEKATELGVTRIVPVLSERTIVRIASEDRPAKLQRWMRIAEDAARQSDAHWLPEIQAPIPFADSLALVRDAACLVGALTVPPPPTIAEAVSSAAFARRRSGRGVALYVGPEGDFSPEELASLAEIAIPVSFGPTILRAETAAIYGLSVLKAHLDAMPN